MKAHVPFFRHLFLAAYHYARGRNHCAAYELDRATAIVTERGFQEIATRLTYRNPADQVRMSADYIEHWYGGPR